MNGRWCVWSADFRGVLLSLSFTFVLLIPQTTPAQEKSGPLVLEHSDQLISSGGDGDIINLVGNVHFTHDKASLHSKRATWYRSSGIIQFIDSVLVQDDNRQITSQMMTYYRRDRRITAVNDVKLVDHKQNAVLTCNKADYFRTTKMMEATGAPLLVFSPDNDTARMEIRGGRMEYYADSAMGTAFDSVLITRHDMTARSAQAAFTKNPEGAILTGSPVIVQNENQLSGDTISIFTSGRKIERLLVEGDAEALYRVLPDTELQEFTTAEIRGRELEAFFEDDEIEKMVTRFNATSYYNPAITDTIVTGTNMASGDSITLYFDKGAINRVLIAGGAQGEYIEPKLDDKGTAYFDTTRYSAEEIDYRFDESRIILHDNGTLRYQDMTLKAGDIGYNTLTRILIAEGLGDSVTEKTQTPVLRQGNEELFGTRMSYNLDTRKGQVRMARTKYEGGYYTGESIRQASEDVLFVSQGDYTSCDLEVDPHYHFHSDKMKMIGKDKVVARPVILYVGDLPVFAVPYYVFPIRKGRHSGFLTFEIGNFERGERFIRNVGYYWAASQYWDIEAGFDFYENQRTILNMAARYELRYILSGGLGINYERSTSWNSATYQQRIGNRWRINFRHSHILSPTAKISGSGTFVSDKNFIPDNVYNPSERLNRTIRSNMNFTKEFKSLSSSMTVVGSQDWNLDTDERRELLPSIEISRRQLPIFSEPTLDKKIRIRPGEEKPEPRKMFYHNIYFSVSSSFQNSRNRLKSSDTTFIRKDYQIINNRGSLSLSQKVLGILSVEPGINLSQTVVRLERNITTDTSGLEAGKLISRETYSLGVSARTTMYGTVNPNIMGLIGLRHSITPSVSYSFRPEVKGNQQYFSYAGAGGESQRAKEMTYRLANLFQAKYLAGDQERKIDLFSLDMSSGYNFVADSLRQRDLSTSMRTSPGKSLNITYNMIHSFYDYHRATRRPLLQPRLAAMTVSTSFNIGYHPGGEKKEGEQSRESDMNKYPGGQSRPLSESQALGFDMAISHSYTESRGATVTKTQWLNVGAQLAPTNNWRIGYDFRYNIKDKTLESQQVNIGRNLHCWEGTFTWIPLGPIAGYYFKVNIKTLPDIKIEKSEGGYAGRRGGF